MKEKKGPRGRGLSSGGIEGADKRAARLRSFSKHSSGEGEADRWTVI
jgi:hypothetical protein